MSCQIRTSQLPQFLKGQEGGQQNLWQPWLTAAETEGIVWKIQSQLPKTQFELHPNWFCLLLNIQVLIHFYYVKNTFLSVQSTRNKFTINTWILFMNSQLDKQKPAQLCFHERSTAVWRCRWRSDELLIQTENWWRALCLIYQQRPAFHKP